MSDAAAERWLARAWCVLVASSALYFLADNEADNDLWVHLFSGQVILASGAAPRADTFSYTAAGAPWIDHEWLTQAGFALIQAHAGSIGLWLLKLAVALLTAWLLWLPVARRTASPWVRGAVMVLTLAVLARGYAVRPQIISYLGVAALLAWLDRARSPTWRTLAAVTAAFALWANAHGAVVVGLGILFLYAVSPPFEKGGPGGIFQSDPHGKEIPPVPPFSKGGVVVRRLTIVGMALIATCLTPYGPRLFFYVLDELRAPHPLTEWQPVHVADAAHIPFLLMLALLALTLPFARTLRRQPWWAVLVAGTALMAVRHQRHTPLFALCAVASLADQCDGALDWLRARTAFRLSPPAIAVVCVALLALAGAQLALLGARLRRDGGGLVFAAADYPVGALRYLRDNRVSGNLALPLDWGGYALWHAAPAIKVSLDGRFATVYPPGPVEDTFAFFRADGDSAAARLLDAYDTTLVLVPRGTPTPLDGRPEWVLLYTDAVAALFGKTGARAAAPSEAPRDWLPFP